MRLLVIDSIPTPYNVPFFAAVARCQGVTAHTLFLASRDSNRQWKIDSAPYAFDYRILPSLHAYIEPIELPLYIQWGLWTEMRRFRPHVIVIGGYHYCATLEVLAYAHIHQIGTVLWSGSHLLSGFFKRAWADAYRHWVITRFDAYLAYGTAARDQLIHYGAPAERVVVGFNTVDVHWFKDRANVLRRSIAREGPLRLLFVGRLVHIKNVGALIAAVGHLQQRGFDVTLTIAGDGPLRHSLREQADRDAVRGVTFLGFRAGDELVDAYVNADVLVLPSLNELWGLVVNEAAACGVASVVSTRAGAAHDLIRDGETGFKFDPVVSGQLESTLERLAKHSELCRLMGEAAQRFIITRDQPYYADRLLEAAELAQDRVGRPSEPTFGDRPPGNVLPTSSRRAAP
jgi:glycosyltransferase involved in cell wall biosynthesis